MFCIAMNLTRRSPSQYIGFEFNSVVEFNGKGVYFSDDGVFEESGATDDGTDISAWFDTANYDFGSPAQKSIEAYDIAYESAGDLQVTLYGDEDDTYARTFTHTPVVASQVQQGNIYTLRKYKYGKARYWKVRVANADGGDFSMDYLALAPVFLQRRAR